MQSRVYSVAEICDGKVKLIDENGEIMYLDLALMKIPVSEGDMLRFDALAGASADRQLTEQKRGSIKNKHKKLIKRRR